MNKDLAVTYHFLLSSHSISNIVVARVLNPLFHWDILFHLSSTGREHERKRVIHNGMTNSLMKMQRQKMLHTSEVATETIDDTGEKNINQSLRLYQSLPGFSYTQNIEKCKLHIIHYLLTIPCEGPSFTFIEAS
jgi:hypothetical protein